jgi:hypothetical protein
MAFELFHKHFTEINEIYWANAIASSTIEKAAVNSGKKPLEYFLVHNEDDRRVPETMDQWKNNYKEFLNYNRLSTLMILSSTFETYLRTIIGLALESKPGTLITSKDCVDGVALLLKNYSYGNSDNKKYLFDDYIKRICNGDWNNRIANYESLFETAPEVLKSNVTKLNEFRNKRNSVGHYIGRPKKDYEMPLELHMRPAERISHEKIKKYFKLIFDVAQGIDKHLLTNYIGSYDLIKYYCYCDYNNVFTKEKTGEKAKEFQKIVGRSGKQPVGTDYYKWIAYYVENQSTR